MQHAAFALALLASGVSARNYLLMRDSAGRYSRAQLRRMCRDAAADGAFTCTDVFSTGVYGFARSTASEDTDAATKSMGALDLGRDSFVDYSAGVLHTEDSFPQPVRATSATALVRRALRASTDDETSHTQNQAPYHLTYLNTDQRRACKSDCNRFNNSFVAQADGKGVTIYMLSAPVSANATELSDRDISFAPTSTAPNSTVECATWHGSHLAGLAVGSRHGVAKRARLVSVPTAPGCREPYSVLALIRGLQWVVDTHEEGPAVVLVIAQNPVGRTDQVGLRLAEDLVRKLVRARLTVVTNAGLRSFDACKVSPSKMPEALTVGALEVFYDSEAKMLRTRPALDSNYGPCVDIWAPGAFIESAFTERRDAVYSGTSQAAAITAGVAACVLETSPELTPSQVRETIERAAAKDLMMYTVPGSPWSVLQMPWDR